ncbi:MAG: DsbA family oxidoreductase, partial [Myxococcales bacterium]
MNVEIWSDIACPWCYIGKRRFEAALAQFEHKDQVKLTWRSFELDPSAPKQRTAGLAAHLASKYGTSLQQANAMMANVARVAADEGLTFRFDTVKDGNTFDAHRLVHLADKEGKQDAMKERLFRAYFSEGE